MLSCTDRVQLTAMVTRKLRDIFSISAFRLFFSGTCEKNQPILSYYQEQSDNRFQMLTVKGHKGIAG